MEISNIDELALLPAVQAGKGLWQNKYHPHDVYQHTVEVVRILKQLKASRELIAAGWLHDIGKPFTKVLKKEHGMQVYHPDNGQPYHSFPDHEKKGKEMVLALPSSIFENLALNQGRIAQLVGFHFLPMRRVKTAKVNPTIEFFCEQVQHLSAELDDTKLRHEVLIIFYADKAFQQPEDLAFLFCLREYLLQREGDLQGLFDQFKLAYEIN